MAFHDKQLWLQAWVLRDRPYEYSAPLACYERWLKYREDLDIGYVLSKPGIMVPPQEPAEYLYEIRALAECVVRELCEILEVLPPTPTQHDADVHRSEVEATNDTNVDNTNKADVVTCVHPPMKPHVGPAWHILRTQDKTLQDLPSQVVIDRQDSVSPTSSPSLIAPQNLAKDLDVVGKSHTAEPVVVVAVDTFVEMSQIAKEVVMNATH